MYRKETEETSQTDGTEIMEYMFNQYNETGLSNALSPGVWAYTNSHIKACNVFDEEYHYERAKNGTKKKGSRARDWGKKRTVQFFITK